MGFFSEMFSVVFDRKRVEGYLGWRSAEAVASYAYRKGRAAMKKKGSKSTSKRKKPKSTARRTGTDK